MSLKTGKILNRRNSDCVTLPMPEEVMERVHQLAADQETGLHFADGNEDPHNSEATGHNENEDPIVDDETDSLGARMRLNRNLMTLGRKSQWTQEWKTTWKTQEWAIVWMM